MIHRRLYLLAALSFSAIIPIVFVVWRRPYRLLVFLTAFSLTASAQNWSSFLDTSRAIDWSGAGFTIPNYSTNCATQPTLTAGLGAAAANTTAIQNALASCDATHNVVNIPSGTYYVASWTYGAQGYQVVRGAGPNSTTLITTERVGCTGLWLGPCMMPANPQGWDSPTQVPPSGSQQCTWSAGYSKGTTVITLSSCGGAPTGNMLMTLYHADDSSDTGGAYVCDSYVTGCTVESAGNAVGPQYYTNGVVNSEQQVVWIASNAIVNNGNGTYSVTISPGVLMDNVRHHTEYTGTLNEWPHARWQTPVVNEGLENLTLQHGATEVYANSSISSFIVGRYIMGLTSGATAYIISQNTGDQALNTAAMQGGPFTVGETIQETLTRGGSSTGTTATVRALNGLDTGVGMMGCYQCWIKNVRSIYGGRNHVFIAGSYAPVVRDNYFYESQAHGTQSYGIEIETMTSGLIENNIFQQLTNSVIFGQGTGNVVGYNYANYEGFQNADGSNNAWAETATGHNAGSSMNLWEGNNFLGIWGDDSWGSNYTSTFFRNQLRGWENGKTEATFAVNLESWSRAFNVVGNVIGQPSYQNLYESYATSTTSGVNGGDTSSNHSIYILGWSMNSGLGGCTTPPVCDALVRSTLIRWGNYDTVTAGTKWDSTEASPGAVAYVNANFTSSYFGSLAHTLPASLYYNTTPSWWPAGKAWPAIGPDVSSGNVGVCTGTYAGAQATSAGQCTGGTLTSAWASHAVSIPAQDCFLNAMGGPPDGSGGMLSFDANKCYGTTTGTGPASPIGLTAVVK